MLDKEVMLRKIREMPVEEMQKLIRQALDESGIDYKMGPGGMSISDFFSGLFTHEETTEEIEISGKTARLPAKYVSPDSGKSQGISIPFQHDNNSFDWDLDPEDFAA